MSDRELPEGVARKQIVTVAQVRDYIRERSTEESQTVSEYLRDSVFPADWGDIYHGYTEDDVVRMKVTPDVHEMVNHMTGGVRVDQGEVIAYYALLDAAERGDAQAVRRLIDDVPEVMWTEVGMVSNR